MGGVEAGAPDPWWSQGTEAGSGLGPKSARSWELGRTEVQHLEPARDRDRGRGLEESRGIRDWDGTRAVSAA